MNKKTQSSARIRNFLRLQLRFIIIGPPKRAFYPKTTKIVNAFALCFSPAMHKFACPRQAQHRSYYGVGRGAGIGRDRGDRVGLAIGLAVGEDEGEPEGVGEVVAVGVAVAVGVGEHRPPGSWHQLISTVSTRHPSPEPVVSLPILHRSLPSITCCGRLTVVVMKPRELPLHARRPASGLPRSILIRRL